MKTLMDEPNPPPSDIDQWLPFVIEDPVPADFGKKWFTLNPSLIIHPPTEPIT